MCIVLARRPLSQWIFISLFLVLVTAMPLVFRSLRRSLAPPGTLTELTERLSKHEPSLYVVPEVGNNPECGIYICTQPQPREQLQWLIRSPLIIIGTSRINRWQGVVFCERIGTKLMIVSDEIQSWGEHGMQIGSLLFFGDPALLRRIHTMILEHP